MRAHPGLPRLHLRDLVSLVLVIPLLFLLRGASLPLPWEDCSLLEIFRVFTLNPGYLSLEDWKSCVSLR